MGVPTREQFVAAYLTLPGTTEEMAGAVYDLLSGPSTPELMAAILDISEATARQERGEGRDGE